MVVAFAIAWNIARQDTALLRAARDAARREHLDLVRLRAEHERLRSTAPSQAEWDALRRGASEAAMLREKIDARSRTPASPNAMQPADDGPARTALSPSLNPAWVPAAEWGNRGRTTTAAAIETTFWAAARGDTAVLHDTLELTPEARAKATELLARLRPTPAQVTPAPKISVHSLPPVMHSLAASCYSTIEHRPPTAPLTRFWSRRPTAKPGKLPFRFIAAEATGAS